MAYGTELILGFNYPNLFNVTKELGLTIDLEAGDVEPIDSIREINKKLEEVWADSLRDDLNLTLCRAKIKYREDYTSSPGWYVIKSDSAKEAYENAGELSFTSKPGDKPEDHFQSVQPFRLDLYYDPDEMGEEEKDSVFGISLITRYSPCFLDLDYPHGGSSDPIRLNPSITFKIEIARAAIVKVLPQWADAEVFIKMMHY